VPDPAAVVFDLDGVLIDSEQVWNAAREQLVRERGGTWHEHATADMMGMSSKEWSQYMHDRLDVPMSPDEINDEVVRRVASIYERGLPLLPHAVETVRELAARWPLGLASSSNRPLIELVLDRAGLAQCFAAVVSSEEVERGKPAPDVYLAVARALGVNPRDCVAIEDSTNGILAASHAGMRAVAVPRPDYPPSREALGRASLAIGSLRELTPAALEALAA
jgi:HAD superfamily hydrolase (TIGR01509 family)